MRGVTSGGLSPESADKVCKMHDRWLKRAVAAEAKVAACEALAAQMESDAQYLRELGEIAVLPYANCTSMDAKALRKALATEVES